MTEMIFYVLMFSFFLNFSFGCMTYSSVHRTFNLMYRGLFECALASIDEDGTPGAHFDELKVEEYVPAYLRENMPKEVTYYTVSYYYFEEESGLVCTNHFCSALKISLKCEFNHFFKYEKAMNLFVSEGKAHE